VNLHRNVWCRCKLYHLSAQEQVTNYGCKQWCKKCLRTRGFALRLCRRCVNCLAATSALQLCQVPVCCAGFIISVILCQHLHALHLVRCFQPPVPCGCSCIRCRACWLRSGQIGAPCRTNPRGYVMTDWTYDQYLQALGAGYTSGIPRDDASECHGANGHAQQRTGRTVR
jgi:hypothetical protein